MKPEMKSEIKSKIAGIVAGALVGLVTLVALISAFHSSTAVAEDAGAPVELGLKKKKSTEVNFDDVLVQGKYHFSDEAVTTVEDDKILDALLGVRTNFKDRIKKSMARH